MSDYPDAEQVLAQLPAPWPEEALIGIRRALRSSPRKVVVLDDDPTGTQTVEDITVVTQWDPQTLREAFEETNLGFFILTNSRALTETGTIELHREILANLEEAANGQPYTIVSRSDSTLRGHFLAESKTIAAFRGPFDLTVIAPFFQAGQRLTLDDTHYLIDQGKLIPCHETPFAEDKVFGYKASHLPTWVEEKTHGETPATEVISIPLDLIRSKGPDGVFEILTQAPKGSTCIVNACAQKDMEVFAAAALRFEDSGRNVLYRTAAAFVAARFGIRPPPPLLPEFISNSKERGGLVVVGSYVPKSSEQLAKLLELGELKAIELNVNELLKSADPDRYLQSLGDSLESALAAGDDVVLYTSRGLVFSDAKEQNLDIGGRVAVALVSLVKSLKKSPGFVIAKGGITSSTIATDALGIRKAQVLGQLVPGVPVWRAADDSRFPEIDLVIFPGNVGGPDSLCEAYRKLKRVR
ncbi:four-carbon acid sugar kinase family protein [Pelagicoccus sp. SDUM812005]|uniref:four-carbon acid sugar kinase family protein n=1 Tax=Pelagicoccus sp. SDUM812005 TaxID=3041257 RepID=UPI00280C83C6|nr:four-carbon acid sugar kinase family protein [Pelagicoccus sp. SDUM812005]MDQ8180633.1 four-carbon acid sugar kinase family protein [Pelagicoccus sp. SDUM812005]